MNPDILADMAIKSLERHGVPVVRSDMPGLFMAPGYPELTLNQLVQIACQRDPAFDPAPPAGRSNLGIRSLGTQR